MYPKNGIANYPKKRIENHQERLGAVGSHPQQCSSTTELGREQMFWM